MDRAYSLLDIRSVSDEERVIEGIASTPTADRYDDIVEPMGAEYTVPMPFLWQHNPGEPVGQLEFAKPAKTGIPFRARLVHPDTVKSAILKERLELAWDSVKQKLVRAVSIGFRPLEYSRLENGGLRFLRWEWLELSLVTIPANTEATITAIKSIDQGLRGVVETAIQAEPEDQAASGRKPRVVKLDTPARDRAKPFVIRQIIRSR